MTLLPNIDKSFFHPGEYIGWGPRVNDGCAVRIRRCAGGWEIYRSPNDYNITRPLPQLRARTLKDLGVMLECVG
jgi:hypothetical protein